VEIREAAFVEVEVGILVADRRGRADQRLDGIEIGLDVLDGVDAEALDQFPGVGPGNAVVRQVGDGDDGEKDGNGEKNE
jgi:hypothetical protein